jgi:hypothetical protein
MNTQRLVPELAAGAVVTMLIWLIMLTAMPFDPDAIGRDGTGLIVFLFVRLFMALVWAVALWYLHSFAEPKTVRQAIGLGLVFAFSMFAVAIADKVLGEPLLPQLAFTTTRIAGVLVGSIVLFLIRRRLDTPTLAT